MDFPLPQDVIEIIEAYEKNGFHAHIVGGPVRDYLLGIPPHDFDITTDATPEESKVIFSGERIIETGIQHGTLTLLKSSTPYEITTYRIDGEYLDGRHPEGVTFTRSLFDDLARRDFTVNAMAYSKRTGLVDLFSGQDDLASRLLRAVGHPEKRFEEDALRILRALRFRSRLGFEIEEKTKKAIFSHAHLMGALATERVMSEFYGILCGEYAEDILVEYAEPLAVVLPELSTAFISEKLPFNAPASPLTANAQEGEEGREEIEKTRDFPLLTTEDLFFLRFITLAQRAKLTSDAYIKMCDRLHTSRHLRDDGAQILCALDHSITSDYDLLRLLSTLGERNTHLLLELMIANGKISESARQRFKTLLEEGQPYRITDLAITGRDLIKLGYQGKAIGDALATLLDATMQGCVENERSALLSYLNK